MPDEGRFKLGVQRWIRGKVHQCESPPCIAPAMFRMVLPLDVVGRGIEPTYMFCRPHMEEVLAALAADPVDLDTLPGYSGG